MLIVKIIFWLSTFIVFYSYIGYGLFIWLYLKIFGPYKKTAPKNGHSFEPDVSLVIATYNEADVIKEKILNCLALDYPSKKLKIVFVADGTTDNSLEIIRQYPQVQLLYSPERKGKIAAINRVMQHIHTPFVVFCDANTTLNKACIREIIQHYTDEKIGAVAGEKKVIALAEQSDAAGAGEGIYWKYESTLKKLDAQFYSVVGAAGELFSIRTHLFEPVPENALLDDFIISLKICQKGYRVMYEPNAYASEPPSFSMKEEQKRKIRISAGGFQSVLMLKDLLNFFKYGKLSFQYISHRVLRWVVCPIMLPLMLLTNLWICGHSNDCFYWSILICQLFFYASSLLGWLFASRNIKVKALYIPYYFVFMNLALYIGFARFMRNNQSVLWEKAKRKS